jgi:chemotaxis protein CheZ
MELMRAALSPSTDGIGEMGRSMSAKKQFRVEAAMKADTSPSGAMGDIGQTILTELKAIRQLVQPTQEISEKALEQMRHEAREAYKIKLELDSMYDAIAKTKREIATLHVSGCNGHELSRVTDELDAVIFGTEDATENILAAAEIIDERSSALSAGLTGHEHTLAQDIQDQIVQVYEACNFQDLTGQRITKVVNTLRFIEERIIRMMDIWGGIESFKDIEVELEHRMGDQALLNGPSLDKDQNIASQDDIDALFA